MDKLLGLLNFIPLTSREKLGGSVSQKRLKRAHLEMLKAATPGWQKPVFYVLAAINGLILISYLFGVNSYSASGYEIRQMQIQVSKLSEENRKLKVKFAEANSITQLQERLENSSYVSIENPLFLEVKHYSQK
jgi:hypothetical protein